MSTSQQDADVRILTVTPEAAGERLDRFLAQALTDVSRSRIKSLIAEGRVKVNDSAMRKAARKLAADDVIRVEIPRPRPATPQAEALPLSIVYEDEHLLVVDKPAGMVVHPAPGHESGTLVNALLHHCGESLSGIGGVKRPGIVHRLDRDTSGLIVMAKTDAAHAGLAEQFAAHGGDGRLHRRYRALIWGVPRLVQGTVTAPIGRHPVDRLRMAVVDESRGRAAVTHYRVLEAFHDAKGRPCAAFVECALETGRTHQIRVHMAHIGHPVMGDPLYARGFAASARRLDDAAQEALQALGRQALHAAELGFVHPITGESMRFSSLLPEDMARLLKSLQQQDKDARR
ncbi:RluA family pseudouridine synthase [Thermopetrobacter sp. TC1]|uniref:RluA family pseudouridine synthase n=1 Tax=Thermopetrobacter sp. TC1 TaxID=1495045 RepID=UPI000571B2EC|nr:RluA family pseudouridine synthase [Thermopetrobacter sp. TC1]